MARRPRGMFIIALIRWARVEWQIARRVSVFSWSILFIASQRGSTFMCYFLSIFLSVSCFPPVQIVIYFHGKTLQNIWPRFHCNPGQQFCIICRTICSEMLASFGEREPRLVSFLVIFSLTFHLYCNVLIVLSIQCHIWKLCLILCTTNTESL